MKHMVKTNHLILSPAPLSFFPTVLWSRQSKKIKDRQEGTNPNSETPIYLLMNSVSLYYKYFLMTPIRHRMLGCSDLLPNPIYIEPLGHLYLVIILQSYKACVDTRLLVL